MVPEALATAGVKAAKTAVVMVLAAVAVIMAVLGVTAVLATVEATANCWEPQRLWKITRRR